MVNTSVVCIIASKEKENEIVVDNCITLKVTLKTPLRVKLDAHSYNECNNSYDEIFIK